MRSRIALAIVGVTALTIVVLGVPLAVIAQRFYEGRAIVELQRRAALAVGEVTLPLDADALHKALAEPDDPTDVTVYDLTGARLVGPGPAIADDVSRRAIAGQPASAETADDLVVATPINDRGTERVVGAVRVTTRERLVHARIARAWALMAAASAVALLGAWGVARRQARRLAGPVERLGERARLLGTGAIPPPIEPSGVVELDAADRALVASASQLSEVLARERAFSANVSHQLRTPLTRLSIFVDQGRAAAASPSPGDLPLVPSSVLDQIDDEVTRLQGVVEHLLALGRDHEPASVADPSTVLDRLDARWQPTARRLARALHVTRSAGLDIVSMSTAALDQVLDVLVDNAFVHGRGDVAVTARPATAAAVVFEVTDEGSGVPDDIATTIFQRRFSAHESGGSGIGLSLARSIVEADGGRLLLVHGSPPTFHVVVRVDGRDSALGRRKADP